MSFSFDVDPTLTKVDCSMILGSLSVHVNIKESMHILLFYIEQDDNACLLFSDIQIFHKNSSYSFCFNPDKSVILLSDIFGIGLQFQRKSVNI